MVNDEASSSCIESLVKRPPWPLPRRLLEPSREATAGPRERAGLGLARKDSFSPPRNLAFL